MKRTGTTASQAPDQAAPKNAASRIHPVVIYPFRQPTDYSDLVALYELVARLDADRARYTRPLTVLDRKTHYALEGNQPFREFRRRTVTKHSEVLDAWCVDTCQMWYTGLGQAWDQGSPGDVYWLIPGDFNYGTPVGRQVLSRIHDLPEIIQELDQDFCVGEITADHNNPKQLIDTYGTFALLYNWFPNEAREIRQMTERPRSEFFAISHAFLGEALRERWYAYEQTMVILLKAVQSKKHISRFSVGDISDLPEGRESFASAMQQVERAERVLRSVWRERNQQNPAWPAEYRTLATQSSDLRRAAFTILQNLLS